MGNQGIAAQFGFEFQKLVFLHYALQLSVNGNLIYEGQDDVESSNDGLLSIRQGSQYVQVKSGKITAQIFEKVLCNWLLNYKKEVEYICFTEFPMTIDYSSNSFINNFIEIVKTKEGRRDSLFVRVREKYNVNFEESTIRSTLIELIKQIKIETRSVEEFTEENINIFIQGFCDDTNVRFLHERRFDRLKEKLFALISESLLNKEPFCLNHGMFFSIASSIKEEIKNDYYEENFDQFKKKSKEQVDRILALENDSVKQLKLVFNNDSAKVIDGLAEQAFYEDLRTVYVQLKQQDDIDALEFLAHSNYKDALTDIEENGETRTPYLTYKRTTSQDLRSRLFSQQSSNFKFYNRGCYIHLTDSEIPDNLKIKWGEESD